MTETRTHPHSIFWTPWEFRDLSIKTWNPITWHTWNKSRFLNLGISVWQPHLLITVRVFLSSCTRTSLLGLAWADRSWYTGSCLRIYLSTMWYVKVSSSVNAILRRPRPCFAFSQFVREDPMFASAARVHHSCLIAVCCCFRFSVRFVALLVVCGWTLVQSPVTDATVSPLLHSCLTQNVRNSCHDRLTLKNNNNKLHR